jgi:tetratricopeptide (TPR) repeat protein
MPKRPKKSTKDLAQDLSAVQDDNDSQGFDEVSDESQIFGDETTVTDDTAGLTAEVSEALDKAIQKGPFDPPTVLDKNGEGPRPWTSEELEESNRRSLRPKQNDQPPTVLGEAGLGQGPGVGRQDTGHRSQDNKYPGSFGSSGHADFGGQNQGGFGYLKVFLILVPFLFVGLGLGGYVAYRHLRHDKIKGLYEQAVASLGRDTFLGCVDSKTALEELIETDPLVQKAKDLLALTLARLHDEYGPNLALKEKSESILERQGSRAKDVDYLLAARFHLGEDPDLQEDVEKALAKASNSARLNRLMAEILIRKGSYKKSKKYLNKSLSYEPSAVRTLYNLAIAHSKTNNKKEALKSLERLLTINGVHIRAILMNSKMVLDAGRTPLKIESDLKKLLELPQVTNTRRARAQLLLAWLYFTKQDRSKALMQVEAAFRLLPREIDFQLELASLCKKYFSLDQAIEYAQNVLEIDKKNIEAKLIVIATKVVRNRTDEAMADLDMLIGKKVPAAKFLVLRGELMLQSEKYDLALKDFNSVSRGAEEKARARSLAVLAYLGLDDERKAYKKITSLLSDHNSYSMAYYALGQYRLKKRLTRSAIAAFMKAVELDPYCYQAQNQLAWMAYERRDYALAEELALKSTEINPHSYSAWRLLGKLKMRNEAFDDALQAFGHAVLETPDSAEGLMDIAEVLLALDRAEEASRSLKKAKNRGADDVRFYHLAGRTYLNLGKMFAAIKSLKSAQSLDGKNPEVLADLGLAQLSARSITKAEATLKKSLKYGNLARAQKGLAEVLFERKKYKDAAGAFSKAAYLGKKKGWPDEQVAQMHIKSGQAWINDPRTRNKYSKARYQFKKAKRLLPDDPEPLYLIAEAWDRDEKIGRARRAYLDILKKFPEHSKTLYRLGLLEYDDSKDQAAKDLLEKFIKLQPRGSESRRARQILRKIK